MVSQLSLAYLPSNSHPVFALHKMQNVFVLITEIICSVVYLIVTTVFYNVE